MKFISLLSHDAISFFPQHIKYSELYVVKLQLSSKYEKECLKSSKLFREVNDLKYRNEQLEKDLNLMKNSRGWRFLEKIRKILRIRK